MKRMKTFGKYLIIIVAFYFISDFLAARIMMSTYYNKMFTVEGGQAQTPTVTIDESKATITNGIAKGKITNDSDQPIDDKYLKMTFLNPKGKEVGTKYIQIKHLEPGESMDFEVRYNYDNVKSIIGKIIVGASDEIRIAKEKFPKLFEWDDLKLNDTDKFILFFAVVTALGV